ncbi:MAG: hypothetical protein ACLRXP_00805 [Oscillospiraceae bacterium]
MGILGDVVLGGGDAGAVLELDDAVGFEQQQGAGFVGGVVGDCDLNGGVGLLPQPERIPRARTAARAREMSFFMILFFLFLILILFE